MAGKLTLKSSMVLMKRLFSCLGSRRKQWIMGYLFSLSEISLTWILPFLYEQTAMLAAGEPGGSLYRIGMYFGWLLLFVPLIVLGAWMRNTAVIYGEGALKKALFGRLCRLTIQNSQRYVTAEQLVRLTYDAGRAVGIYSGYAFQSFVKFLACLMISMFLLLRESVAVAAAGLALTAVCTVLSVYFNPKVRAAEQRARRSNASATAFLAETGRIMDVVRVFQMKEPLARRYEQACGEAAKERVRYRGLNGISEALMTIFTKLAQPAAFIMGLALWADGRVPVSKLVYITGIIGVLAEGMSGFALFMKHIQPPLVSAQRVYELMDLSEEKLVGEESGEEESAGVESGEGKLVGEEPAGGESREGKLVGEEPAGVESGEGKLVGEESAGVESGEGKLVGEESAGGESGKEKPAIGESAGEGMAGSRKSRQKVRQEVFFDGKAESGDRKVGEFPCREEMAAVEFQGVSFSYDSKPTLRDLSFSVRRGEVAVLVGASGNGKSTILKLLLGFYAPREGSISLFGRNTAELGAAGCRALIGYVPQEGAVFSGNIAQNLRMGKPSATDAELMEAVRLARMEDFVSDEAALYSIQVGEEGALLSGGQRQRISIARALLRDAPVLVLDEATAALDGETERGWQDTMTLIRGRKTILAVAHRQQTVVNADRVFWLEDGRIADAGTHQELMERSAAYRRMYRRGMC